MFEVFAIFIAFLIIDAILCIKIVPIFGMIFGVINLPVIFFIMMPDTSISIYYSFILGLMAVVTIAVSVLKIRG